MSDQVVIPEIVKIGNLTRDPEFRYGQNDLPICETDLAVNPPKNSEQETQFYRLVMFRNLAANASDTLSKSMRVIVVGRPTIDEWTDKETGEARTRKKIMVTAIGPDLRFATATVERVERAIENKPVPEDF